MCGGAVCVRARAFELLVLVLVLVEVVEAIFDLNLVALAHELK